MNIRDSVVKCDKIKNNKNELVFIGCPWVIHNYQIKKKLYGFTCMQKIHI